jgi:hypothetical protein
MGWAFGMGEYKGEPREIGYGVQAECDEPGCSVQIDRGFSYRCTDRDPDRGCGGFFCGSHLYYTTRMGFRCRRCARITRAHAEQIRQLREAVAEMEATGD